MSRPETGPMKFDDDWTGVFIRGDNAFHYGMVLKEILSRLETIEEITSIEVLIELLSSPTYESVFNANKNVQKLKSFSDCKENTKPCAKCHGLGDIEIPHGNVDCPICREERWDEIFEKITSLCKEVLKQENCSNEYLLTIIEMISKMTTERRI